MYTGHAGVALGAYGIRRSVPLWLLILASQLPDWADAGLCLANARSTIPGMYSHSVPAIAVLALGAALLYCAVMRDIAGMWLVAMLVIAHALGDYVTGLKPTWPGGPMIGLEIYLHPVIDFVFETIVLIGGWLVYRRSLAPKTRSTEPVFTLLFVLIAIQIGADIVLTLATGLKKC